MARKKLYNTPEELREHRRTYFKTYRANNADKIKKTYDKAKKKVYYLTNLDKIKANAKAYYLANVDKIKTYNKAYQAANLDKMKAYCSNRRKTNIQYKLSKSLRNRLNKALKRNNKTGSAVKDLGCTIDELKTHLESKFQSGMTWDNWSLEGWHIDHVKPLASFDLTDKEQLLIACHYTNLQPLWAKDNLIKGDKIISYNV